MALKHAIRALFKLRAKKGKDSSSPRERDNRTHTKPKQRASETDVEAAITEFATHLRQLAANGHAAAAGSIQVLGLEDTKKHFGPKWPHIAERVHRVIADIIEKRLARHDKYARLHETAYVMVFAGLDRNTAAMKAALIAEEISKRLFGDKEQSSLIKVGVAKIDTEDAGAFELLDAQTLIRKITDETAKQENIVHVGPATPDTEASPRPDQKRDGSEAKRGQTNRSGSRKPRLGTLDQPGNEKYAWDAAEVSDEPASPEWIALREELLVPEELFFVYHPAWLVRREMIAAHCCVPARLAVNGTLITGGRAMPSRGRALENFGLDVLGLHKARNDLDEAATNNFAPVVVIPVHIETLETPKFRDSYVECASGIDEQRRRQVLFEIMGFTDETPSVTLVKAISYLRPYCREIIARTRLETRNLHLLREIGVQVAGVDLANLPFREHEWFPMVTAFNERAANARLTTFAHGLKTRSSVSGAVAAGFRYLDGRIIASPVEKPLPNRPWTARDVYSSLVSELQAGTDPD